MKDKDKILHRTVKSSVLDLSTYFWTTLWFNPTLYVSDQKPLILQKPIWGYKLAEPPNKHQKSILAELVFHIYRKHHSHLSVAIVQIIVGDFFFVVSSCDYSMACKGEMKQTRILCKGCMKFYRKIYKLTYTTEDAYTWQTRYTQSSGRRETV